MSYKQDLQQNFLDSNLMEIKLWVSQQKVLLLETFPKSDHRIYHKSFLLVSFPMIQNFIRMVEHWFIFLKGAKLCTDKRYFEIND